MCPSTLHAQRIHKTCRCTIAGTEERMKNIPYLYPHMCPRYGVPSRFGYSPLTNLRTYSSMNSLSTCTTVSSTWSQHITITFLWMYKGCCHAPRIFSIDQNFLNSFFLFLEFLLWALCPCPNHCCPTLVTHSEQKQKTHSSLPPSRSDSSCPWSECLTSTPALVSVTMVLLSFCLPVSGSTLTTAVSLLAIYGWAKLFPTRNVSSKFRKGK